MTESALPKLVVVDDRSRFDELIKKPIDVILVTDDAEEEDQPADAHPEGLGIDGPGRLGPALEGGGRGDARHALGSATPALRRG